MRKKLLVKICLVGTFLMAIVVTATLLPLIEPDQRSLATLLLGFLIGCFFKGSNEIDAWLKSPFWFRVTKSGVR